MLFCQQQIVQSGFNKLDMLILLCGLPKSGKKTVASFLSNDFEILNRDGVEEYVMNEHRWRNNYVVENMELCDIQKLRKRPFVLIMGVEAPIGVLFERSSTCLKSFVEECDLIMCKGLREILHEANIRLMNDSSIKQLHQKLKSLNLDQMKLRPSWDSYFMEICEISSKRSNCMKRRVGCVLVKNNRILNTGYNGTPFSILNCCEGGCLRCNSNKKAGEELDTCLCMHAEENALLDGGRESQGTTLYCTTFPCLQCAKKIIQCGVVRVVYGHKYAEDSNANKMLCDGSVEVMCHDRTINECKTRFI